jgi:hypothetical protein
LLAIDAEAAGSEAPKKTAGRAQNCLVRGPGFVDHRCRQLQSVDKDSMLISILELSSSAVMHIGRLEMSLGG